MVFILGCAVVFFIAIAATKDREINQERSKNYLLQGDVDTLKAALEEARKEIEYWKKDRS